MSAGETFAGQAATPVRTRRAASSPAPRPDPAGTNPAPRGRASRPREEPSPAQRRRRAVGAQLLTLVYALSTLLAAVGWLVTRGHPTRLEGVELAAGLLNVPLAYSLVSAAVLALVTRALLGRKRVGLLAVAAFQVLGMLLGVAAVARVVTAPGSEDWPAHRLLRHSLDIASIGVGAAVLVLLWSLRHAFEGHTPPGSWRRLSLTVAAGLGVTVLAATALVALTAGDRDEGPATLLAVIGRSLGLVGRRQAELIAAVPAIVPEVCSALLALTLLAAVAQFLRSGRSTTSWSGARELALRDLLTRHGEADSLGYFGTRRDRSSVFSPDGRAAVTYRVRLGVSLAAGDPLGEPQAWGAAIDAWREEARYYGWLPVVVSASEAGARAYVAAGLRPIAMGDEAVLEPSRFSLAGTAMTPVRHAAERAARAGLTTTVARQRQLAADEVAGLAAAAERWRRGDDRGFSMALDRSADPADGDVVWVAARDADGRLQGVLSFVPWGLRGLSLDLMRRAPDAPNGVTELMVTDLLREAPRLGLSRVSLNFCVLRPLWAAGRQFGAGTLTRINYSLLGVLDRFWQLERLYRSNQKYDPAWVTRFLCYEDLVALPQALLAVASVEGFLPALPDRGQAGAGRTGLTAAELVELDEQRERAEAARVDAVTAQGGPDRERSRHLEALRAAGRDPYPVGVAAPTIGVGALAVRLREDGVAEGGEQHGDAEVQVAGRVRRVRDHGGVVFADVQDGADRVQVLLEERTCGRTALAEFTRLVDSGDLVGLTGRPGRSRNGTPALLVRTWAMHAKSLHAIPFDGLTDPRTRLRRRSTDLIVHPEVLGPVRARAIVMDALRGTLREQGYLEVETPMLHTVHGGASARPFTTVSNAYGVPLSLRIAPELYLKRLLVGGSGPIFEVGRNFRNEGADASHNPEFTSLEVYRPYADYTTMRLLTEDLIKASARALHGAALLRLRSGPDAAPALVDVSAPWPVVPVLAAVSAAVGREVSLATPTDELLEIAREHGVAVRDDLSPGALVEELYADLVEAHTFTPTFYTDFPQETSPLTAPHRSVPGLVERWDLVVNGMELGTAYSELTDPVEQRRRLTEQSLLAAHGDPEAMEVDEDFLYALETGMPPTGGMGMGVDRLLVLLTSDSIREVLTFPFVRPGR